MALTWESCSGFLRDNDGRLFLKESYQPFVTVTFMPFWWTTLSTITKICFRDLANPIDNNQEETAQVLPLRHH